MRDNEPTKRRGALLIDADNIPSRHLPQLLDIARENSDMSVRRVYANFASSAASYWMHHAVQEAISCEQVACNVPGKNSSDIALVIDAVDLSHEGVEVFVIASADSDFTRLAIKLRERGCTVIIAGTEATPQPLKAAASTFVQLGLTPTDTTPKNESEQTTKAPDAPRTILSMFTGAKRMLSRIGVKADKNDARASVDATTPADDVPTKETVLAAIEDMVRDSGGRQNIAVLAEVTYKRFGSSILKDLGFEKFKLLIDEDVHLHRRKNNVIYYP